jgi:Flp pilus assembly protein TadG
MRRVRPHRREGGASIVELALIAPILVMLVMGVLDLGRAYRMQIRLENAAREGAAYAQLHPNRVDCPDGDDIKAHVLAEDSGIAAMPGRISVWAGGSLDTMTKLGAATCGDAEGAAGRRWRVDVAADFEVLTPMVSRIVGDTIEITGSAEIEVQG